MTPTAALADALAQAEREGRTLAPDLARTPASLDEAEAVQTELLERLRWTARAWKLGASTHGARGALGLSRVFSGAVPAGRCLDTGARLPLAALRQRGVECELALTVRAPDARTLQGLEAADLPEREALARRCVLACHSALELPQSRWPTLGAGGPLALVADNGAAGWVVLGPAAAPEALHDVRTGQLWIDGAPVASGDTSAFVMPPLALLADHLVRLARRGLGATGPTTVLLGSVTPYHPLQGPARVRAAFDGLPAVELELA